MSVDQRAREAARSLRADVDRQVDPAAMLTAVRRSRTRRRVALVLPAAAAAVFTVVALQVPHDAGTSGPSRPAPTGPGFVPERHTNGELVGSGNAALTGPHVPPITERSSPTWSPGGNELAVLASDGILVTDVGTGDQHFIPCSSCGEIAWSPDGGRFAVVNRSFTSLSVFDISTWTMHSLGLHGLSGIRSVAWSPTADRIAFTASGHHHPSAVFTVGADGRGLTSVWASPLQNFEGGLNRVVMWAISWSANDQIAVLTLNPMHGHVGRYDLGVMSVRPDGSAAASLGDNGTCACVGWTPDLTWSPDGTTLAITTLGREHRSHTLDMEGRPVTLQYVHGSGPLAWQPR